MEILVVSHSAPYDTVGQAGEKTHNYYLKEMQKRADFNIRLISFCAEKNISKLDLDQYGIINNIFEEKENRNEILKRKLKRAISLIFNSNDQYANFVSAERRKFVFSTLKHWKNEGYQPDCIILEWTHMILLAADIKKIYPNVPVVASSHDVNYIGSKRRFEFEKNQFIRIFRKRQYLNLKRREIASLAQCDLIVPQNENDIQILKENDALTSKSFHRIVPYYDSYRNIQRNPEKNMLVFFGAMGRSENYLSVKWFVEEVFNHLNGMYQLVIIGGNPPEFVKMYASDNVTVTGFVPQSKVEEYFGRCTCMVVPLKLGSGIKVKVLEAFSASIPVITNSIGNEGVFAREKTEYIRCETAQEYIDFLTQLQDNNDIQYIGENARRYVDEAFNLEKSKDDYIAKIGEVIGDSKR